MSRFLALSLAVLLLAACQSSDSPDSPVLARVGEAEITVADFERELALRAPMRPGYYEQADKRRELLDSMIDRLVQLEAAGRAGVTEEPEFRDLVERMAIQRLREIRLDQSLQQADVSDTDVADYYQSNIEQFTRPERRQVALIRISRSARDDEAAVEALRARAQAARDAALGVADQVEHFGRVAVDYSDDRSSRYQGGVVGWLVADDRSRYRLDPALLEAAFELTDAGAISPVIETGQGFWLLRLVALERARQQPLAQVSDGIRHRLIRQRAEALEVGLLEQLRAEVSISVDDGLLADVPAPPSIPPEREPRDPSPRPPPLPGGSEPSSTPDQSSNADPLRAERPKP